MKALMTKNTNPLPRMVPRLDGEFQFPRRSCIDQFAPAEAAIRDALIAVEMLGADVLLTQAVTKLQEAQSLVANWLEGGQLIEAFLAAQPKDPAPGSVAQWRALPAGSEKALHQAREALMGPVADGFARRAAVDCIDKVLATPPGGAGGEVVAIPTPGEIIALKERGDMAAFLQGLTKTRGYICLRAFIRQMEENGTASDDEGEDTNALAELADAIAAATPAAEQGDAKDARPDSVHSDSGDRDRVQAPGPTDAERYQWLRENSGEFRRFDKIVMSGCELDRAIDAAILASKPTAGEGK